MKFVEIDTERLILQAVTPEVYDYIFQLGEQQAMDFFGCTTEEELASKRIRHTNGLRTHNKTFLYFQLIEKKTDEMIGWCGFHTWYTDHNRAELGYGLSAEQFKRKGFMSEAIPPVLEYGFNEMNLHRIEAFAAPWNKASIKLLKYNNFEREGLMKEHYLKDGVYEDSEIYGLINTKSTSSQ